MNRVEKPWGYELHWAKTDKYVGKLIHVNAGHALSLQYHNQKDETIFLWSGRMLFEIKEGDELVKREMKPGEAVHITPKTVHRMTAIEDCDIFEVSTPSSTTSCGSKIATAGAPEDSVAARRATGGVAVSANMHTPGRGCCCHVAARGKRLTRESCAFRMARLL